MKLGLDFHGVIDTYPEYFAGIMENDCFDEIHIVTGMSRENFNIQVDILEKKYGIYLRGFTHFFSIEDTLERNNCQYTIDDKGGKRFDERDWGRAKGSYCWFHDIDLHVDDSKEYGDYFRTGFHHFTDFSNMVTILEKTFKGEKL